MTREADAYNASILVNSEVFDKSVRKLDQKYIMIWRNARTVEAREDAHRRVLLLAELVNDLKQMELTGDLDRKREKEMTGKKGFLR